MVKLSKIRLDHDAIREGRWVAWLHGIELRIAAFRSPEYREESSRALRDASAGR